MKKLINILWVLVCIFACTITAYAAEENGSQNQFALNPGTQYYESAWGFGSGKNATVGEENPYTDEPYVVWPTGYAALDEQGRIIKYECHPGEENYELPETYPEGTYKVFVHAESTFRLGWVDKDDVKIVNGGNEKLPQQVVDDIKDIAEDDKEAAKTVLVIDYSGSMAPHQAEVLERLECLPLHNFSAIYAFASDCEKITKSQLMAKDFNVGELTYMTNAFTEILAAEGEIENIIIISDLYIMDLQDGFPTSKEIKSVIIYDPDWYNDPEDDVNDPVVMGNLARAFPTAKISWNEILAGSPPA